MSDAAPDRLRILVVDPLPGLRAVTRDMLEEAGHEVLLVSDWPGAETLMQREEIQAIVMSWSEHGFDGAKAAAKLRDRLPPLGELPLVGISAGLRHGEEEEALDAGFDVLLFRPFSAEELEQALQQAVKDRTPPPQLDPERRAALRQEHGPAALAALDDKAMEAATLLMPLYQKGGSADDYRAAAAAIGAAMREAGAIHAAEVAARMEAAPEDGKRLIQPLMSTLVAARTALRKDRLAAARQDPIWAASDPHAGDTP